MRWVEDLKIIWVKRGNVNRVQRWGVAKDERGV
jgi:hypothetical protein